MATAAQVAASQLNAARSTGPRTESGKSRSSSNNLRHGFRSQSVLLPGDDPTEYESLLQELSEHFEPRDLTEERFVREMTDAEWRLRRVRQYMESALSRGIGDLSTEHPNLDPITLQALAVESLETSCATWLRYETKFERQYERAFNSWARYQHALRSASRNQSKAVNDVIDQTMHAPLPPGGEAESKLASNVQKSPDARIPAASLPSTPRGAPCPCGSGLKYKRCCGQHAKPVLCISDSPKYQA